MPTALAGPVVMVAVPVELLVGAPEADVGVDQARRPGSAPIVFSELLPVAVLPPVLATARRSLLTVADWLLPELARRRG